MPINMEIRPKTSVEKMLKKREHFSVSSAATRGHRDGKAAHQHPEGQLSAVADGLLIISVWLEILAQNDSGRLVGNPYLGITSGLPVICPKRAIMAA